MTTAPFTFSAIASSQPHIARCTTVTSMPFSTDRDELEGEWRAVRRDPGGIERGDDRVVLATGEQAYRRKTAGYVTGPLDNVEGKSVLAPALPGGHWFGGSGIKGLHRGSGPHSGAGCDELRP
jgi:hypothetical protein